MLSSCIDVYTYFQLFKTAMDLEFNYAGISDDELDNNHVEDTDERHPWHQHYAKTSEGRLQKSQDPVDRIIDAETIGTIQDFRNKTAQAIFRSVPSTSVPPTKPAPPLQSPITMEEPMNTTGALYVLLDCSGSETKAVPLHKEVTATDRPDLLQLTLTPNSEDVLNGKTCLTNYHVGDMISVMDVHRRPKTTLEQFQNKAGFKFWNIAKFALVKRNMVKDVLISVLAIGNQRAKTTCIAMGLDVTVQAKEPIFADAGIRRKPGTKALADILVPARDPGQLLASIGPGSSKFFVVEQTRSHPAYPTIHPMVLKIQKLDGDDGSQSHHPFGSLIRSARLGLSGIAALENMSLDRFHYPTQIEKVTTTETCIYLKLTISNASGPSRLASWKRSTEAVMETRDGSFQMTVESAIPVPNTNQLVLATTLWDNNLGFEPNELRGQDVVVYQSQMMRNTKDLQVFPEDDAFDGVAEQLPGMKFLAAITGGPRIESPEGGTPSDDYIKRFAYGQENGLFVESAIGCGKTEIVLQAAVGGSHHSDGIQVIATTSDAAARKLVDSHLQLDSNNRSRVVRMITKEKGRLETELDYPIISEEAIGEFIETADTRTNTELLIAAIDYFEFKNENGTEDTKEGGLTRFDLFMEIFKPKVIIGTTTSILATFHSHPNYARQVDTIQMHDASLLPLHSIIALVARCPQSRFSVIGDVHQLSASVSDQLSVELRSCAVGDVLKAIKETNAIPRIQLSTVFRCPPRITKIASRLFYNNRLRPSTATAPSTCPLWIINTESQHTPSVSGTSLTNEGEANKALKLARRVFYKTGSRSVAVLCFFTAQAGLCVTKMASYDTFVVRTVEESLGEQYEAVVILTTRSSAVGSKGLTDPKRINVAISRATKYVAVFGNAEELKKTEVWSEVVREATVSSCTFLTRQTLDFPGMAVFEEN